IRNEAPRSVPACNHVVADFLPQSCYLEKLLYGRLAHIVNPEERMEMRVLAVSALSDTLVPGFRDSIPCGLLSRQCGCHTVYRAWDSPHRAGSSRPGR